jgi:hypothetical protein
MLRLARERELACLDGLLVVRARGASNAPLLLTHLTQPLHAPALHILARRVAPKWRGRHSLAAGNCRSEFFFKNSRGLNEEIMELNCRQALF